MLVRTTYAQPRRHMYYLLCVKPRGALRVAPRGQECLLSACPKAPPIPLSGYVYGMQLSFVNNDGGAMIGVGRVSHDEDIRM
jgi:hypothetical protein